MKKKQLIVFWILISLTASGCAPAYKFRYGQYGIDKSEGYAVSKGECILGEFTQDACGNHPQDLKLAKKRFKRRREVVEKYYKKEVPQIYDNQLIFGLKFFVFTVLFPISALIMNYHESCLPKETGITAIEQAKKDKQELKQYIEEDCKRE